MGKKILVPCLEVIMIPEKYTVKDHISTTKLEKDDHSVHPNTAQRSFSHYNLILRKL